MIKRRLNHLQRHRHISHDRQQLMGGKIPFIMITGYEVSTEEKTKKKLRKKNMTATRKRDEHLAQKA